jgi:dihydrofolate reductase
MATVVADMSMSLDGFVAGPDDEVDAVVSWMMAGDVAVESKNPDLGFKVDEASAAEIQGWFNTKALVIGRRTFDPRPSQSGAAAWDEHGSSRSADVGSADARFRAVNGRPTLSPL